MSCGAEEFSDGNHVTEPDEPSESEIEEVLSTTSSVPSAVDSVGSEHSSKSKFSDFFEIQRIGGGKGRNREAQCKLCPLTTVKMTDGNTSGLKKHMHNKHINEYYQLFPQAAFSAGSGRQLTLLESFSAKTKVSYDMNYFLSLFT